MNAGGSSDRSPRASGVKAETDFADETKPAFGTISKFASVPAVPGFPEGVAIHGNFVFVSGPAPACRARLSAAR